MLEIYAVFTLMMFSFALAGIMALVVLGVAENEVVDSTKLFKLPRIELRLLFIVTFYVIFLGVLEGFTLYTNGILISLDSIPFVLLMVLPKGDTNDH